MARPYVPYRYNRRRMKMVRKRRAPYRRRRRQRRPNNNRVIRQYKRRMVRMGKIKAKIPRPLSIHRLNYTHKRTGNSIIYKMDAFTEGQKSQATLGGIFTSQLTLANIMAGGQWDDIQENYLNFCIESIVLRVQLYAVLNAVQRVPTPSAGFNQLGGPIIGTNSTSGTPEIYCKYIYQSGDAIPLGVNNASVETTVINARQQWAEAPRVKRLFGRKPASMYWNAPQYARQKKSPTGNVTTTNTISAQLTCDANQAISQIAIFWADYNQLLQKNSADTTAISIMVTGEALIKCVDNGNFLNVP